MKVALFYNRPVLAADHPDSASEAGVLDSVTAIEQCLIASGHETVHVQADRDVAATLLRLQSSKAELVINLCEGVGSAQTESYWAAMLELLDVPYTGASPECLAVSRDKCQTKLLLQSQELGTPNYEVIGAKNTRFSDPDSPDAAYLKYLLDQDPLLVKPEKQDASLGITSDSVVTTWERLVEQITWVQQNYGSVLIEHYVTGREFNVGILTPGFANEFSTTLPIAEIEFLENPANPWSIVTYDSKWNPDSPDYQSTPVRCPANLPEELASEIGVAAWRAFCVVGARDYARVDLRVTITGEIFILEVNANPDLSPTAGFARALQVAGISYQSFVDHLVETAVARGHKQKTLPPVASAPEKKLGDVQPQALPDVLLREYRTEDREPILRMLADYGLFRQDEIEVAAELLDEGAQHGSSGHYQHVVVEQQNEVVGWACFGLIPLTDAAYDLYWIVAHPQHQRLGIGRQLLEAIEQQLMARQARWLLAETSDTPEYAATRAFYLRCGFTVASDLPDFYRQGDGRIVYTKRITL